MGNKRYCGHPECGYENCQYQRIMEEVVTQQVIDQRFTISTHDNGYYQVSIPNYKGGEVVNAEAYDKALFLLRQILQDLPTNRDWLDPQIEREARQLTDLLGLQHVKSKEVVR